MSVLHHESILESLLDQAWEEFRIHNKLTVEQMTQIENHEGVHIALAKKANKMFEDLCR